MTRRVLTRRAGPAAAVLLALALSACGDATEDYCADLREQRTRIADLVESDSPGAVIDGLPMLRDLAEQSPDDLADEWQTFLGALEGLEQALEAEGVSAGAFAEGRPPAGLDEAAQQRIARAADQVRSEEVVAAAAGIEQQARDVCKINLGL